MEKDIIQRTLKDFNFNEVHKIMTFLNWEWEYKGVPTIEELKKTSKSLLNRAINEIKLSEYFSCYSGGFQALAYKENGKIILELQFICESSSSYY